MNRAAVAGLVAVLAVATLAPLSAGASTQSEPPSPAAGLVQQGEFDSTEFEVTVAENGSARWTFRYFRTLDNESERDDFRAYAEEFRTTESQLFVDFRSRAGELTARGANVTGRDMAATRFAKDASLSGPTDNRGVVEMSFTWTRFGAVDGDRVVVADVFQGGFYISTDQDLVFAAGPGLYVAATDPPPDDSASADGATQSVTYEGEQEFNDRKPRVVFAPPSDGNSTTATPTASGTDTPAGGDGDGGLGMAPLVAIGMLLVVGVGAAYLYRSGTLGDGAGPTAGSGGGTGGSGGAATAGPAVTDEELLSDEDRVLQLLEEHGGRMKQVDIVEQTDWSKSKVSMLLSDMADDDQISKLRVGRENIVSLAGQEPDAAGSPFDDEE